MIDIVRTTALGDGRIESTVIFPSLDAYSRCMNAAITAEPKVFDSIEAAHAYAQRHAVAQAVTGRRIPRASVPPFPQYPECSTLGGQPLIVGQDEPPLRACDDPDNRPGGTD